ncbi:MAG: rhodanese-like domain-containing protein [Desulfobulbus sp.]|nr:rhodanese-like domain-containing protein [Desulfobulbus sp.]
MRKQNRCSALTLTLSFLLCVGFMSLQTATAQEVEKGKIPQNQLAASYKKLAWGVAIWDVPEAVEKLAPGNTVLWVDTRPESFFKQGTVQGAVLLVYDKKGAAANTLSAESLDKALTAAGLSKETATIAFFCQGPACHRSYNATFAAVSEWGYSPDKVVWFRAGYPHLLQEIKTNAKLKRKAKQYLSDAGVRQL